MNPRSTLRTPPASLYRRIRTSAASRVPRGSHLAMTSINETRPLHRVLRGQHARQALARLVADGPRELRLDGTELTRIDAYGGAMVGAAMRRHLARGSGHALEVLEPADDGAWSMLYNLLGGALPSRATWSGTRAHARRDHQVLLPAMALDDDDTVELVTDEALPKIVRHLGYGDRAARAVQEAAAIFAHNAMTHGADSPIAPILCCALDAQGNDLQLVVADLGAGAPDDDGGPAIVQDAVRRSRANDFGSLAMLASQSRGGLQLSVRLAHGTGRGRYRTGGSWHYSPAPHVPGFIAGLEIHC